MSLILNDGRADQSAKVTGIPNNTSIDVFITLGSNGASFLADEWSFLIDQDNGKINDGNRIHRSTTTIYIWGSPHSLQIDSGTVYTSANNPSESTINSLLTSGAVIKIFDFPVSTFPVNLFGTDDANLNNMGMYADISQIVINNSSDDSNIATFDLTTPASQYTNNGITLDIINYAVADTTPPTFTSGPSAGSATGGGHTISSTIDEAGSIYAVRLADGATAPSSAQVKAGNDSTNSAAPEAKASSVNANTNLDLVFNTGAASTPYDYYVVAEDSSLNIQASPTLINATTTSGNFAIDGGVLEFGAAFTGTYTGMASIASPIVVGPDSQGNTLNVTITDNADGTFSGTMPALSSSGSSSLILVENNLTLTATEV